MGNWAVLESLQRCRIDYRYNEVIRCLNNTTMSARVQVQSWKAIPLKKSVRQGNVISYRRDKLLTRISTWNKPRQVEL